MSERFSFEIQRHIGTLKSFPNGWAKELNLVQWNGADAKFDIRDWDADHNNMTRGVTLREDEARQLASLLQDCF